MSNLQSIIDSIKSNRDLAQKSWIYYNKADGSIVKITNKDIKEPDLEKLMVNIEEAEPMLLGKRKISDYFVKYDIVEKCLRLVEKTFEDALEGATELCHEIPLQKTFSKHITYTPVYEGIEVYLFHIDVYYEKNWFIWHEDAVYRLEENTVGKPVEKIKKTLIVDDVLLGMNWFNIDNKPVMSNTQEQIYKGIPFIDIWYKDVAYVTGQHVWYKDAVYKYNKDVEANKGWKKNAIELVVDEIILHDDTNTDLELQPVNVGDKFIANNFLFTLTKKALDVPNDSYFYGPTKICTDNKILFDTLTGEFETFETEHKFADLEDCHNGQLVLIGKNIHLTEVGKEVDLLITQNLATRNWEFELNPYTRRFLHSTNSNLNDTMHFSITEKDDPHVLLKSMKVSMQNLIAAPTHTVPFTTDWERNSQDVSLFTSKFFKHYKYERVDGELHE